jgi:protein TonB
MIGTKRNKVLYQFLIGCLTVLTCGSVYAQNETENTREYVEREWKDQDKSFETQDTVDNIYDFVDVPAEFPGGYPAFQKYLLDSIVYPQEAVNQQIQGNVYVEFIVFQDGRLDNFKILRSPHELLSNEALRVVKTFPNLTPAQLNGRAVSSRFRIPIAFRLPK